MKAAVLYGPKDLRIIDRPVPQPGTGEVLIRVRACGVCGTDMHIFDGDEGAAPTPVGTALGHEFAGEIALKASYINPYTQKRAAGKTIVIFD